MVDEQSAQVVVVDVPTVTRTLMAAGYEITGARRQPRALLVECERIDVFGSTVQYLVVVCDDPSPPSDDEANIRREAEQAGRILVLVATSGGPRWLGWSEFLEALGGAVPTWQALTANYPEVVRTSARNILPDGYTGEAWRVHEEAVADGLEFILGRRVRRLGGLRRGRRVGDVIALTPNVRLYVVDAKAAALPYSVGWPELRPIAEYVEQQRSRQLGQVAVNGAVIIAAAFEQDDARLTQISAEFIGATHVSLAFMETEAVLSAVSALMGRPDLRNAVAWSKILSYAGRVTPEMVLREVREADEERYQTEPPPTLGA